MLFVFQKKYWITALLDNLNMKLDKLEINGFKSFKNKTVMEFPDKFTAIIGPNGSGKSNIIDSICFVLGKSRGLRASNLVDLIYNGGIGGKKADIARVNMILKNSSGERTKLSREINKDGRSIYKINDKRSTRGEILELIGDSEYNIVLQDDVTRLIDMKPKERRQVIDDLCGIREYDEKKDKALKELEKVEDRISDTYIVLGEKETYLKQLGEEKDEALKYQNLTKEKGDLKASLIYREMRRHSNRIESIESELHELTRERDAGREKLTESRKKIAELNMKLKQVDAEIHEAEKEKGGRKLQMKREKLIRLENQLDNARNEKTSLEKNIKKSTLKKKTLEDEIKDIDESLTDKTNKLKKLQSEINILEEKAGDRGLEDELDGLKSKIFELHSRVELNVDRNEEAINELEALEVKKSELESFIQANSSREKDLSNEYKNKLKSDKNNFQEYEKLREEIPRLAERRERILDELNRFKVKAAQKKTEIKTMESTSGGLHGAVSAVMKLGDVVDGINGIVSQLGGLTDKKYETALQVAAGAGMQYMVVEDDKVATKCITYLRERKIGRMTFLPLNKINIKNKNKPPRDSIGFARDFIKTKKKYKKAFDYIFQDTVLVKDLAAARKIGVGSFRMVTLDGDLLLPSGAMTGGFLKKDRFIKMSFSSTENLEAEVRALERRIIELDGEQQMLSLEKKKLEKRFNALRKPVEESRTNVDKLRLEKENLLDKREDAEKKIQEIKSDIIELKKNMKERIKIIKSSEKEVGVLENKVEKLMGKRSEKNHMALDKHKDTYRDLDVERGRLEEKRSLLLNQIGELNTSIKSMQSDAVRLESSVGEISEEYNQLKGDLYKLEAENKALMQVLEKLGGKRQTLENETNTLNEGLSSLEESIDGFNDRLNYLSVDKAKSETKLIDLVDEFDSYANYEPIESSIKDMESRLVEVDELLTSFESVNLKSIESYALLEAEIGETKEKVDVLKGERESIFEFMEGVERKKKNVFMEAFEVVNDNFARIYGELSGGEGKLTLDNPREISESGLLINASPRGKKLLDVDAMSGGEKVLTCSAFMLAIQQFKPSHFYIVDELDAALDVENSLRLARMLRDSGSQFVLVTHNDQLMKHAESVIGVSMSAGVSEIVGVKLGET